ncbi:hypothetical protein [Paenibacillus tianjinensis]|uniref:Immunity protein 26 n=1 Tax=Paenibacillus tianjinensis TaxID=2810347 RepID=A0ABX7L7Q1_9BACL|nr:hypothetical protein [Paenibacillus tianjinensis]QSF43361.1 hypothetical protein JRJ22_19030 [Paenibacillus tianjinensis]
MRNEKHLTIGEGDRIRLLTPLEDGVIRAPLLTHGRIVSNQNQVEANVWLNGLDTRYWNHPIRQALQVDRLKLEGIVVNITKNNFAVVYRHKDHSNIQISSEKTGLIPFFSESNIHIEKVPSGWYMNGKQGFNYRVKDIIDLIEDRFCEWVQENCKSRKIRKWEKQNGDFPEDWDTCLTDESAKLYDEKRKELEMGFAENTGLFHEFYGGLIFE